MIEVGIPDISERIISHWHKKRGLVYATLLTWGFIAFIINYLEKDNQLLSYYIYFFLGSFALLLIVWLFSSYRLVLRNGSDLVLAIMILVDEEEEVKSLYRISKRTIDKIKDEEILKNVKIVFLPTNFIPSQFKAKKYIKRNSNSLDVVLILHARSGNIENDHKVSIREFEFVYNLDNLPYQKNILFNKIDFISEIKLQNFHKNWVILNSNSYADREKIKNNFQDMLFHAIAIKYLLLGNEEKALSILEKLLNHEKLKIEKSEEGNAKRIKPQFVSQTRILFLLTAIYLALSDKYMYVDAKKTLKFLIDLENLAKDHSYSFLQYVRMARMYYECNDLKNAILYTDKAAKIDPKHPNVYINRLFFGVINNDWKSIYKNLKEILHKKKYINNGIVDVVSFLDKESRRYTNLKTQFSYVINSYEAIFLNQNEGKENLRKLIPHLKAENAPEQVIYLANKIIESS